MPKMRLVFSKQGRARYISHLDLTRVFHRAMIRAGIILEYSQGYNPHPYFSAALPLPIGVGSRCELLDFGVAENAERAMELQLPEGLRVLQILDELRPVKEIFEVRYEFRGLSECAMELFDGRSLVIDKKSKSGVIKLDIAPYMTVPCYEDGVLSVSLRAQDPTVNPEHFRLALNGALGLDLEVLQAERVRLLDHNGRSFCNNS